MAPFSWFSGTVLPVTLSTISARNSRQSAPQQGRFRASVPPEAGPSVHDASRPVGSASPHVATLGLRRPVPAAHEERPPCAKEAGGGYARVNLPRSVLWKTPTVGLARGQRPQAVPLPFQEVLVRIERRCRRGPPGE